MDIHELYRLAQREEIDYSFLIGALKNYHQPRNKIQAFLRVKDLIRVKKGIYVFGERARKQPYSKEVLANLIYGPSAISLEYALSYYGLIPERVVTLTSITNNRKKKFTTPLGEFDYTYLSSQKYSIGITQIEQSPGKCILMAMKEKALADLLTLKTAKILTKNDLYSHLIDNLRIDEQSLKELDYKIISMIANRYKNHNVKLLQRVLEKYYA